MICKKKETRTIFELFNEYNCEECSYYCNYEEIKIGNDIIKIYYMGSCLKRYNDTIDKRRARLLLKDICVNEYKGNDEYIFLWLNHNDDLSNYYDWFNDIMEYGRKIIIIA